MRYIWVFIVCTGIVLASGLSQRYTSYRYVLDEFDINRSFIDNRGFQSFVKRYEKWMRRFYRHTVNKRQDLARLLRQKLLEDDLSDLFLYLSIVESGLKTNAVSNKKAVGLWQFMPKTASDYKLKVYGCIDERCDPVSATDAAIRHLRRLHQRFGKWYLAILAYNCGEGRLSRAIAKAGTDDLEVLIDPQNGYLPKETIEYIQKIVLIAMMGENEIMDFSVSDEDTDLIQVEVNGGTKLSDLARILEIPSKKLISLNPAYKKGVVPDESARYPLLIPEAQMVRFYMRYEQEKEKPVTLKPYLVSHKVALGETLDQIARSYGSTVEEITLANQLRDAFLEVNTTLLVPVSKEVFEQILEE
jgi:membrane-bound lytic murein transglycosylase D